VYIFTSYLPEKKQVCQQIDRNVRFSFRHWTASVAVSFLCFQLAAGQNTALIIALQPLLNAINSDLNVLQPQATTATQQIHAIGSAGSLNITQQIQAASNSVQQFAASINATSQQAQDCLNNQTQTLTAINNTARK
jgi:hypothetical protein